MGARVLVVDDDPWILRMVTATLQKKDFVVDTAREGRQALERAQANPPDIIISDVMMPVMDGWTFVQRLRGIPRLAAIPVIFLTALGKDEAKLRSLGMGPEDFLPKPFRFEELEKRVSAALAGGAPAPIQAAPSGPLGNAPGTGPNPVPGTTPQSGAHPMPTYPGFPPGYPYAAPGFGQPPSQPPGGPPAAGGTAPQAAPPPGQGPPAPYGPAPVPPGYAPPYAGGYPGYPQPGAPPFAPQPAADPHAPPHPAAPPAQPSGPPAATPDQRLPEVAPSVPGSRRTTALNGRLEQLGLSSLLVMMEMERKDGVLSLRDADSSTVGRIFLRKGQVISAALDGEADRDGKECVYAMLAWSAGTFSFSATRVDMEDTVNSSTTHLLMEGARLIDEAKRDGEPSGGDFL